VTGLCGDTLEPGLSLPLYTGCPLSAQSAATTARTPLRMWELTGLCTGLYVNLPLSLDRKSARGHGKEGPTDLSR